MFYATHILTFLRLNNRCAVMAGIDILKDLAHEHTIKLHSVINDPDEDNL